MKSVFSEDNLYIFAQVAKHKNLSRAADELGLTSSAISYAIKRMETYLGMDLLQRNTRNVELTEAGNYFYQKAVHLLNDFNSIQRSLNSINQGIEFKLRICINNLMHTPYHTSKLLSYIKQRFPLCQVIITTEVYNGVWDAILNKNIDIAIGAPGKLVEGGGLDYIELGRVHWKFVIAPNHPLANAVEPIPESVLRLYPSAFIEDTALNITKKVGWLLHGQEIIKVPDLETKYQVQRLGVGIGFLPDYMVRKDIEEKKLIEKEIKNPRQPSRMLLAIKHELKGEVAQWIEHSFSEGQVLRVIYDDLIHR
ncbi:LysR substrate-binding domain-containing protein [Neisseria sp. Ec49-e6-T10]|uniref:LysR substrate-binding domain-containing protein n=1 Tax=Neisseria sp. Ec49-e6-T10 TaxID=3140744 RepID=UPI003EC0C27D